MEPAEKDLKSPPKDSMILRERVRQWKSGMESANRFEIEEALRRTPAERFKNHQTFLNGHASFGLAIDKPAERRHITQYHEIQEKWLARHPEHRISH